MVTAQYVVPVISCGYLEMAVCATNFILATVRLLIIFFVTRS